METLVLIIVVVFIVGLLSRDKGEGFLDTLSSGCSSIIWIIIILVVIAVFIYGL